MRILLIAETLEYAQYILRQFYEENRSQVTDRSVNVLRFEDGTAIYATSVNIAREGTVYMHDFDQILITDTVNKFYMSDILSIYNMVLYRTNVPEEFVLTVLEEC